MFYQLLIHFCLDKCQIFTLHESIDSVKIFQKKITTRRYHMNKYCIAIVVATF